MGLIPTSPPSHYATQGVCIVVVRQFSLKLQIRIAKVLHESRETNKWI